MHHHTPIPVWVDGLRCMLTCRPVGREDMLILQEGGPKAIEAAPQKSSRPLDWPLSHRHRIMNMATEGPSGSYPMLQMLHEQQTVRVAVVDH
eukprot:202083-Pelagomonas_calceolata.AAC.5